MLVQRLHVVATLSLAAALVAADTRDIRAQSARVVSLEALRARADSFVRLWRYHWEVSDRYRTMGRYEQLGSIQSLLRGGLTIWEQAWPRPPGVDSAFLSSADSLRLARWLAGSVAAAELPRSPLLHCHPAINQNVYSVTRQIVTPFTEHFLIRSDIRLHSICPSWYPRRFAPPWDERSGIDYAILEPFWPVVRKARAELLQAFDVGVRNFPTDDWLAGQQLRFQLDQGDTAAAINGASRCAATAWWCSALNGYLFQHLQRHTEADSAFIVMLSQMDEATRCEWSDISFLVMEDERRTYARTPCAARDSLHENFWWLSDPEYGDNVNERRAEHFARQVLWHLRSATGYHERWDMRRRGGASAVREMLVRYGWPSFSYWLGRATDESHFSYLGVHGSNDRDHGRFATAEYSWPRVRLTPSLTAALDPVRAQDFHWAVSENSHMTLFPADTVWWPIEHFDRVDGAVAQLWNQHGFFRRDEYALLALASDVSLDIFPLSRTPFSTGDTLTGSLFRGTAAGSMSGDPQRALVGSTNVFKSAFEPGPQLLSLELHGSERNRILARTRFSVSAPQPLRTMQPGEFDISPPVLLHPAPPGVPDPRTTDQALTRMYGTVGLVKPGAVSIYWETYGIAATDSVDLSVRVERHARRSGLLGRLARTLGLASDPARGSVIAWTESEQRNFLPVPSGTVPIQGRVLSIDFSDLASGEYTLHVSVTRAGQQPVTGSRYFWIVD